MLPEYPHGRHAYKQCKNMGCCKTPLPVYSGRGVFTNIPFSFVHPDIHRKQVSRADEYPVRQAGKKFFPALLFNKSHGIYRFVFLQQLKIQVTAFQSIILGRFAHIPQKPAGLYHIAFFHCYFL